LIKEKMIKELLIKVINEEIKKIKNYQFEQKEEYSDGLTDGLEKAISIIKKILE